MKLFLAFFFFYSLAHGDSVPITPACKESSKEVKVGCSKDNFAQAWADAFNQVPFKYSVIFEDMEKCTKSVALCYYNCSNKTLTKSSGMSTVTGALRNSYGKKPHTAEIINCRGYLSDYAKEVEGTCEAEMIKLKSKLDSEEEGMKTLSSNCLNFANFETPELEGQDEYTLLNPQTPNVPNPSKVNPFKYQGAGIDVTSKVKTQETGTVVMGNVPEIKAGKSIDPLKLINNMNQGEPGGGKKDNPVAEKPQPTNLGVIQNPNLLGDKKRAVKNKPARKKDESSLKKISDQLATNNYQATDSIGDQRLQKFQIAKEKSKLDHAATDDAPLFNGVLSNPDENDFHQRSNSGALGFSLFHKNTKAIEQLRKNQMTLE